MGCDVYVITIDGVDWSGIKHVCATEETARKRFEEVKQEMIEELEAYVQFDKEDGCKDCTFTDLIEKLKKVTFDAHAAGYYDCPMCKKYTLEQ